MTAAILRADARALPLPDASVDSIVCDPPYSLSFMGREWDSHESPAAFQAWCLMWAREAYRVLKPGGFLLSFGGTRTYHRLTCAIEDAGFEIRDSMAWMYSQGFPKSLNVNNDDRFCRCKSIDWMYGTEAGDDPLEQVDSADLPGVRNGVPSAADQAPGRASAGMLAEVSGGPGQGSVSGDCRSGQSGVDGGIRKLAPAEDDRPGQPSVAGRGDIQAGQGQLHRPEVRPLPDRSDGDGAGGRLRDGAPTGDGPLGRSPAAAHGGREPHRPESAEQHSVESGAVPVERGPQAWRGWPVCSGCGKPVVPTGLGTALKPGFEPIVVARKPLIGTVAANVLQFGTGALNIDGCRIPAGQDYADKCASVVGFASNCNGDAYGEWTGTRTDSTHPGGRWPTNVVMSHPPLLDDDGEPIGDACADGCVPGCPVAELDAQSGVLKSGLYQPHHARNVPRLGHGGTYGNDQGGQRETPTYGDSGGASRFFPTFRYEAKAPTSERPRVDGVAHPTVKPLGLIRFLCRLVTQPGGLIVDMFGGSGTTGEAALMEGFDVVVSENEAAYLPLIEYRINRARRRLQPGAARVGKAKPMAQTDGQGELDLFGSAA